jgi:DNA repair photolyase
MRTIYTPTGRALEYSPLACNLYTGCAHGCLYCYAPDVMRADRKAFHSAPKPRAGVLQELAKRAVAMRQDPRRVLLCFNCDPYQPLEAEHRLTRSAIEILASQGIAATVLTKAPMRALQLDKDVLVRDRVLFGTTMVFCEDAVRQRWEPGAEEVGLRIEAMRQAKALGLQTWVSLEPIIDPAQTIEIIRRTAPFVDEFKAGKLNHDGNLPAPYRGLAARIAWRQVAYAVLTAGASVGAKVTLKRDLQEELS